MKSNKIKVLVSFLVIVLGISAIGSLYISLMESDFRHSGVDDVTYSRIGNFGEKEHFVLIYDSEDDSNENEEIIQVINEFVSDYQVFFPFYAIDVADELNVLILDDDFIEPYPDVYDPETGEPTGEKEDFVYTDIKVDNVPTLFIMSENEIIKTAITLDEVLDLIAYATIKAIEELDTL